jgi:hypothetical protein
LSLSQFTVWAEYDRLGLTDIVQAKEFPKAIGRQAGDRALTLIAGRDEAAARRRRAPLLQLKMAIKIVI